MFRGLWDRALELRCRITHTSDRELRCLPTPPTAVFFLDPGCEEPIGARLLDECDARYAVDRDFAPPCGEPGSSRVYEVGDPVPAPAEVYHRAPGGCEPLEFSGTFYQVSAVDLEIFATGQLEARDPVDGLVVRELVTASGARFYYDVQRESDGEACAPSEENLRCTPTAVASFSVLSSGEYAYYADGDCTRPAARYGRCKPRFAQRRAAPDNDCDFRFRYFLLDDDINTAFASDGLACTPSPEDGTFAQVGEELTELDAVEFVSVGNGTLTGRRVQSQSGQELTENARLLHEGEPCTPMLDAGNVYRCVREAAQELTLSTPRFADPACEERLAVQNLCQAQPVYAYESAELDACASGRVLGRTFRIGPLHEGSAYELVDGFCTEVDLTWAPAVFTIGEEVEPDVFPMVELVEG